MNRLCRATWVALLGAMVLPVRAETVPDGPVTIAQFRGDHAGAITYVFDDGLRDQFDLAVPMLDQRGLKGTFVIVGSKVVETDAEVNAKKPGEFGGVTWARLKEISKNGHEIGNHSWTHANLRELDDAGVEKEIVLNDNAITEKVGTYPLVVCYPGNNADNRVQVIALKRHLADRNGGVNLPPGPDGNVARSNPFMSFGFGGDGFTLEKANAWADQMVKEKNWGVAVIHGIEAGYSPLSSAKVLADHLDHAKAIEDRLWIDTYTNVAGYLRTRSVAKVTATMPKVERAAGDTLTHCLMINLSADLPPPPKGITFPIVPLTLVISAPGVKDVKAERHGATLPATIKGDHILVDAVASPEPIMVNWK